MDKIEFAQIIIGLKTSYPRFSFLMTDKEKDFWYQMLKDIDGKVVQNAVLEHINTNVFPPSIADIRRLCTERYMKSIPSFDDSWGKVQRAIGAFGWNDPESAYKTFDNLTLEIVKNIGWNALCHGDNQAANRANFREAYEKKAEKIQKEMQLPEFVSTEKFRLQQHYIPVTAKMDEKKIESAEKTVEIHSADATPEQIEKRERSLDELRRQMSEGKI